MNKILIDTSAWIDFLRSKSSLLGDNVARAIKEDKAVLCGVVVAELLQGAKGIKEQRQLKLLFDNLERVQIIEKDWDDAGHLLGSLRAKGITLPLTDAVIAVIARRSQLTVLTLDKHFEHLPIALEQVR